MNEPQAQTITPERQQAAAQVGAVFNSLHEYLRTLEPKDAEGRSTLTQQLVFAHCRVDEAAMWAIKSVLTYGLPPRAAPATAPTEDTVANDAPAVEPASETPAPIGVVDPPQDVPAAATPVDNAPTGADAMPPTTPTESV